MESEADALLPAVLPAMFAESFRHLAASGCRIDHIAVYEKMNASKRMQRRVVVVAGGVLASCTEAGNVQRSVRISDIQRITLCEVAVGQGHYGSRVCIVFSVPSDYDLVLFPIGDGEQRAGSSVTPVLATEVLRAASTGHRLEPTTLERIGRFAGRAADALTPDSVVNMFRTRKPETWIPRDLLLTVDGPVLALQGRSERSDSEETASVVEVVDISPARRALRATQWQPDEEEEKPLAPAADDVASPARAVDDGHVSPVRRSVVAQWGSAHQGDMAAENASLRDEVAQLREEVAYWRNKFLREPTSAASARHSAHISV